LIRYRKLIKKRNIRWLYALAFMFILFCEVGSHAMLDSHGHDEMSHSSTTADAEFDHHDHECECAVACDEDSQPDPHSPNLPDQSSHHDVLVPSYYFSFLSNVKEVEHITTVSLRHDLDALSLPFLPPKHS
jgi:hypothetical protein